MNKIHSVIGVAQWSRVKAGAESEYRRLHQPDTVWPELQALVTRSGFLTYEIFMKDRDLFAYLQVDDLNAANKAMSADPVFDRWMSVMAPLMDAPDPLNPWTPMERVYRLK